MAKNVLFLIHGVGDHKPGWSKPTQKILDKEFTRYMVQSGKSTKLKDELEFVEISYNDIFTSVWSRWSELVSKLEIPNASKPVFKDLTKTLGKASASGSQAGNNKKIDYAGDAVLYYTLELVQRLVQLKVMSIISSTMADRWGKNIRTEFGVLGHSLGTAVAHDALQRLGTTKWTTNKWESNVEDSIEVARDTLASASGKLLKSDKTLLNKLKNNASFSGLAADEFQFSAIIMVANTSRILSRSVNPYKSVVRPRPDRLTSTVKGFTDYFVNISHDLDPVAQIKKFDTKKINQPPGFAINVDIRHLYAKNVHALEHYVINPAAHRDLFEIMCANSFGSRERAYANSRFDTEFEAANNPDYFKRRGGDFSDEVIKTKMRDEVVNNISDILERLT